MIKITNGFVIMTIPERQLESYMKSGWKEYKEPSKPKETSYDFDETGLTITDNGTSEVTSDTEQKQLKKNGKKNRTVRN